MTGAAGGEEEDVLDDLALAGDGHQHVLQEELTALGLVSCQLTVTALCVLTHPNLYHLNINSSHVIIVIITVTC